jgi:hypothetical protein
MPVIVLPFSLAIGATSRRASALWASHLPAEAYDGIAVAQKPRVSGVVGKVDVAAVHESENAGMAPIGSFEEERAVAFVGVLGADCDEAGGELHFALFKVDCVTKIHDWLVVRIGNGERNVDVSPDVLVGSCLSELPTDKDVGTRVDFNANHACVERRDH